MSEVTYEVSIPGQVSHFYRDIAEGGSTVRERRGEGWARLPTHEKHTRTAGSQEIYLSMAILITINKQIPL